VFQWAITVPDRTVIYISWTSKISAKFSQFCSKEQLKMTVILSSDTFRIMAIRNHEVSTRRENIKGQLRRRKHLGFPFLNLESCHNKKSLSLFSPFSVMFFYNYYFIFIALVLFVERKKWYGMGWIGIGFFRR